MDNICHTLVGGALARAGFDRRTPLATATMMIGANFPDIDVLAIPVGAPLARRGITHGIPALILLPFVLTGLIMLWDRWVRRRRDPRLPAVVPRALLLLSAISILSHSFFDWLNVYGMRWLMPMRDQWFYGDTLFIADLWLWIALAVGYVWSGRTGSVRPARIAVLASSVYIALMAAESLWVRARIVADRGLPFRSGDLMVAPVPIDPFGRQIVLRDGNVYRTGSWSLFEGTVRLSDSIFINRAHPAVGVALRDDDIQTFMGWARFPHFIVESHGARTTVHIIDARYGDRAGRGFATVSITVASP